jgi:3-methylcrotonyl-CoA carboxylase alpha subunit
VSTSSLQAVVGTHQRELSVSPDGTVTIGGQAYQVRAISAGAWHVWFDGGAAVVYAARDDDACWVHVNGCVHRVEISRAGVAPRRKTSAGEHALAAPMPATVLSLVASVGQAVRAGDTVLMLEAMKMELPVRAPRDGVVAAIHCREGELVQPGVILVDLA